MVFNQIIKNNIPHTLKQIYKDVNEFCNEYSIDLLSKEMEHISLYIYDIFPHKKWVGN